MFRLNLGSAVSVLLFFFSNLAFSGASLTCGSFLVPYEYKVSPKVFKSLSDDLFANQDAVGRAWAYLKKLELDEAYKRWTPHNIEKTKAHFLLHVVTDKKPIPVVKSIDGKLRLIDNHHGFLAMHFFMGSFDSFEVHVILQKDYTKKNEQGVEWTEENMVKDFMDKGFIYLINNSNPQFIDLLGIPKITQIQDFPARSMMGLVFRGFDEVLKGSYFEPMVQLRFFDFLVEKGFYLYPKSQDPLAPKNIKRIVREILQSEDALEFLIENIKSSEGFSIKKRDLKERVRLYLEYSHAFLRQ